MTPLMRALTDYESKGNTVEEFGVLLSDATMPTLLDRDAQSRKTSARVQIGALDGGEEALRLEEA